MGGSGASRTALEGAELHGVRRLIALLLYGAGLRFMECLTLRVKDIDFGRMEIEPQLAPVPTRRDTYDLKRTNTQARAASPP